MTPALGAVSRPACSRSSVGATSCRVRNRNSRSLQYTVCHGGKSSAASTNRCRARTRYREALITSRRSHARRRPREAAQGQQFPDRRPLDGHVTRISLRLARKLRLPLSMFVLPHRSVKSHLIAFFKTGSKVPGSVTRDNCPPLCLPERVRSFRGTGRASRANIESTRRTPSMRLARIRPTAARAVARRRAQRPAPV